MQRFQSIHYLRAVAALMVVVLHLHTGTDFMHDRVSAIAWLEGGVDIFFIISGFVMVKSTAGNTILPQDFFIRRCQRIVPLYWLATLIMMTAIPGEFLFKLGSMFFLPMANPHSGLLVPVVEPGWTLNYEMFFYLLFALSLLLAEKWRFWALAGTLISLATVSLILQPDGILGFYTNPIMLEFLLGMAIAKFGLKGPILLIPIGFAAMYFLYPQASSRLVSLGIPAALIIIGAVGIEHKMRSYRVLNVLGDASYSIYVFHLLVLGILIKNWDQMRVDQAYFAPVAVIFVIVTAVALHWFLERPIIAFFARRNAQSEVRCANTADSIINRQANNAAFNIEKVSAIADAPNSSGSSAISTTTSA